MAFDFPDSSSLPDGYRVTNPDTFSEYAWQVDPGKWVMVNTLPMSDLFVDKTGDTMSGPLLLTSNPALGTPGVIGSDPAQAVHKQYVDDAIVTVAYDGSDKVSLDGSTSMASDLDMGTHSVKNAATFKTVNGGTIVENTAVRLEFDGNVKVNSAGFDVPGFNVEGYVLDKDKFFSFNGTSYTKQPLIEVDHHSSSKVDDIYLRGHVLVHEGLSVVSPIGVSCPFEVYDMTNGDKYYRPNLSKRLLHVNPGNDSIMTSQVYVDNFSSANERSLAPKKYVDTTTRSIVTGLRTAVDNSTTFSELKTQLLETLNALAGDDETAFY